jgi:ureidoacrylate peracid hydrolase
VSRAVARLTCVAELASVVKGQSRAGASQNVPYLLTQIPPSAPQYRELETDGILPNAIGGRARGQSQECHMGTQYSIVARPESVGFDAARTAVMVIDMQHDFGGRGGMFDLAGLDIAPIERIVQPIARVLDAARDAGLFVVYTRQEHNPDLSDAGSEDAPHRIKHTRLNIGMAVTAPDGSESRILVRDTWNTAIVAELAPQPGDVVVSKHRYSAFFGTALDSILRARGIDTLIFTGATTSICVESTVRDATFRDYRCIVLRDCTTELIAADAPRSNHEASLLAIELLFGWTAESDALIGALSGAHRAAAE